MSKANHGQTETVGIAARPSVDLVRREALAVIASLRGFVVIVWALAVLYFAVIATVPTFGLWALDGLAWGFQCDDLPAGGQWCTFEVGGPGVLGGAE